MDPLQERGQISIKSTLSPLPNIGPSHFREESRAGVTRAFSRNSLRSPLETDSLLAGYQIPSSGLNLGKCMKTRVCLV